MISVQIGQCGNQLGFCLLNSIFEHILNNENYLEFYFHSFSSNSLENSKKLQPRTVCIDTEPKVINECVLTAKQSKNWIFNDRNLHYLYGGAGNNWALGYSICSNEFVEKCINSVRRELEDIDIPSTIVILHSVGGGTGSGVGTKITEEINNEVR